MPTKGKDAYSFCRFFVNAFVNLMLYLNYLRADGRDGWLLHVRARNGCGSRRIEHFLSREGIFLSMILEMRSRPQRVASFRPRCVFRVLPSDETEEPHDEEPRECGGGHH